MSIKRKFQEYLTKYGGSWLMSYVEKNRLEDDIVNSLILEEKDDILLHYISFHIISPSQITVILNRDEVGELMLAVVRRYMLDEREQKIVVEKNNVLLLEAYLCPNGYFEPQRRFKSVPEYIFIYNIVKSGKLTGVEIFKTYVDNFYKTLLTPELVDLLIKNEDTFATKYIFQKAKVKKEWEEDLISKASDAFLKTYINEHEFSTDAAQLALVRENFPLAQVYYEKYKLRPRAQQLYHSLRQAEIERKRVADTT